MVAQQHDPEGAVARLHAAGEDVEALQEALVEAAFLDAMPGDHRQKLRGASGGRGWLREGVAAGLGVARGLGCEVVLDKVLGAAGP